MDGPATHFPLVSRVSKYQSVMRNRWLGQSSIEIAASKVCPTTTVLW